MRLSFTPYQGRIFGTGKLPVRGPRKEGDPEEGSDSETSGSLERQGTLRPSLRRRLQQWINVRKA